MFVLCGKKAEVIRMRELKIAALNENLPEVLKFIGESLENAGCKPADSTRIEVAVEEIFSNIANYAYNPETGSATVSVELSENPLKVIISFADNGTPYNPLAKEDPNLNLAISERKRGGLGIFMTKKFMDKVSYEYKDGMNILTIEKLF